MSESLGPIRLQSAHSISPCQPTANQTPRPLTLQPRVGITGEASGQACWDAAEYQCVLFVSHLYPPVSSSLFLSRSFPWIPHVEVCARQQQLHLSVISFWKQWLAYNMHNQVTPGSYWRSQIRKRHESSLQKMKTSPQNHICQLTLPPASAHESPLTD